MELDLGTVSVCHLKLFLLIFFTDDFLGSRFALMETKAVLYYLLLNFTFEVCEKTEIPLVMGAKTFGMMPNNGIWLEFKTRNKN